MIIVVDALAAVPHAALTDNFAAIRTIAVMAFGVTAIDAVTAAPKEELATEMAMFAVATFDVKVIDAFDLTAAPKAEFATEMAEFAVAVYNATVIHAFSVTAADEVKLATEMVGFVVAA